MTEVCLTPNCRALAANQATFRGLCLQCYGQAKKMVEAGETTWEQLEEMGLAGAGSKFKQAFNNARKDSKPNA